MKLSTQRSLRRFHTWLGLFFAPGILFFSATGFLQVAGFAEGRSAPRWIAWSASFHTHQQPPRPRPERSRLPAGGPIGGERHDEGESFVALKPYVVFLAAMLFVTTAMGVAIAFANRAARLRSAILLAAGVVVPVVLALV